MSDADDPRAYLKKILAERGYVLDYHKALAAEDLEFFKTLNALIDLAYKRQRLLDQKTKEMAFIAALVGLAAGKEHIKIHMNAAKRAGASKEEVLELLEMLVCPCGVPKFMMGYDAWAECFEVNRVEPG